jgi:hypothetical protein
MCLICQRPSDSCGEFSKEETVDLTRRLHKMRESRTPPSGSSILSRPRAGSCDSDPSCGAIAPDRHRDRGAEKRECRRHNCSVSAELLVSFPPLAYPQEHLGMQLEDAECSEQDMIAILTEEYMRLSFASSPPSSSCDAYPRMWRVSCIDPRCTVNILGAETELIILDKTWGVLISACSNPVIIISRNDKISTNIFLLQGEKYQSLLPCALPHPFLCLCLCSLEHESDEGGSILSHFRYHNRTQALRINQRVKIRRSATGDPLSVFVELDPSTRLFQEGFCRLPPSAPSVPTSARSASRPFHFTAPIPQVLL